ncbi:hypothetical protein [Paracerasibacillus soli]|uniref:hypothetical protein n=1 Tax=Paracerasibacillus soli TaxID=480284 RepID=UPI00387E0A38
MQKAISHAEEVVKNAKAQEEVTEAITQLQKALAGLERLTEPEPSPDPGPSPEPAPGPDSKPKSGTRSSS